MKLKFENRANKTKFWSNHIWIIDIDKKFRLSFLANFQLSCFDIDLNLNRKSFIKIEKVCNVFQKIILNLR